MNYFGNTFEHFRNSFEASERGLTILEIALIFFRNRSGNSRNRSEDLTGALNKEAGASWNTLRIDSEG